MSGSLEILFLYLISMPVFRMKYSVVHEMDPNPKSVYGAPFKIQTVID